MLQAALPHRPPMVWLDEVLSAGASGGTCGVTLRPGGLYTVAGAPDRCLTFAPVEWMAQAYGYARACYEMIQEEMIQDEMARTQRTSASSEAPGSFGLRRAFLVGVSELELPRRVPAAGRLLVEARLTREMAPLALVDGSLRTEDGELLAAAKLKLYFEH
jgi:hypothetical protein